MLFSEPPQAFRLKAENTATGINAVIGFIGFPSWAGKRPSENQIQGFQTALIIAEVMYGQIYRRINGKTPVDTGIALIFFRKFRCPAGAMISLVRASALAACLGQTAVQPSTNFSGLPKKGRLKTIHPVFRRPFSVLLHFRFKSEQAVDHAVCVHVDFLGGGDFRQAGHFHHVAAQGDDEACAGGNGDAAHGDAEAFWAA